MFFFLSLFQKINLTFLCCSIFSWIYFFMRIVWIMIIKVVSFAIVIRNTLSWFDSTCRQSLGKSKLFSGWHFSWTIFTQFCECVHLLQKCTFTINPYCLFICFNLKAFFVLQKRLFKRKHILMRQILFSSDVSPSVLTREKFKTLHNMFLFLRIDLPKVPIETIM